MATELIPTGQPIGRAEGPTRSAKFLAQQSGCASRLSERVFRRNPVPQNDGMEDGSKRKRHLGCCCKANQGTPKEANLGKMVRQVPNPGLFVLSLLSELESNSMGATSRRLPEGGV